ncbi:MAG TPA: hypothetical protein VFS67_11875 [Polyangiaceae bacterium]|nr:hypothetical protein [Polyangiaceae bacterium]
MRLVFSPPARRDLESGTRHIIPTAERAQDRFLGELAQHTDGIGGVHLLHCLARHGIWDFLQERAARGATLRELSRRFGARLAYLNVVCRVFSAQGWIEWQPCRPVDQTQIALSDSGYQLITLLSGSDAAEQIVRFLPVATQLPHHLFGSRSQPRGTPELAELVARNAEAWGLLGADPVSERFRLALEGNLVGPVAVALKDEYHPGWLGAWLERIPRLWQQPQIAAWAQRRQRSRLLDAGEIELKGERAPLRSALHLLRDIGWLTLEGDQARLTAKGRYAAARAWGYGVPVSYLPLFGQLDALLFGDHRQVLRQVPGRPEGHIQRRINVKASGASHGRYFAAADEVIVQAFNLPLSEQPRGFADMGSGDGSWLQHVWELIRTRTERGRVMSEDPPLMVGIDYHRAARRAARERLTRAGVPHLVLFGDVNDPEGLRARLRRHGVDSRDLLHGSSFLIHNRPYQPPRGSARDTAISGAYVADGEAIESADLQQNLIEFFQAWAGIIGRHGMLAIELHDPERVVIGKTLTNYILTHGLSEQLTVGITPFLEAARAAGLEVDPARQRLFPAQREQATVSVNHFTRRLAP